MNTFHISALAAALAFSAGAIAAQGITKDENKSGKDRIAADYKEAKAACASQTANAKDVCMAEAKGREKVARAELEARYMPGAKGDYAVSVAKAEADYAVDREKCVDKAADARQACVKEAKATEARAKDTAKAHLKTTAANKGANVESAAAAKKELVAAAPKKESASEYVDDAVVTAKIKGDILKEPSLKSTEINVETYKGVVQLSGFVRSKADIDKAVQVARGVKGAASVKNDMIVKGQQ